MSLGIISQLQGIVSRFLACRTWQKCDERDKSATNVTKGVTNVTKAWRTEPKFQRSKEASNQRLGLLVSDRTFISLARKSKGPLQSFSPSASVIYQRRRSWQTGNDIWDVFALSLCEKSGDANASVRSRQAAWRRVLISWSTLCLPNWKACLHSGYGTLQKEGTVRT